MPLFLTAYLILGSVLGIFYFIWHKRKLAKFSSEN